MSTWASMARPTTGPSSTNHLGTTLTKRNPGIQNQNEQVKVNDQAMCEMQRNKEEVEK